MHQFFKNISGILVGLCPVIIAIVLAYFLYTAYPSSLMLIAGVVLLIISLLIGYSMFKECRKVGILDFMGYLNSTKDMNYPSDNDEDNKM